MKSSISKRTSTAYLSVKGANLNTSFDEDAFFEEFKIYLSKRLLKKGIELKWVDEAAKPELIIRVVEIEEGSQLGRFLLTFLFLFPAIMKVECEFTSEGNPTQKYQFKARQDLGLFGGTARSMVNGCGGIIIKKIVRNIFKIGRGGLILTFAIFSIHPVFIPLMGIPALIMGIKDLIKMKKGEISKSTYVSTLSGVIIAALSFLFYSILFGYLLMAK